MGIYPLSKKLEENTEYIKKKIGIGISFDVGVREFYLKNVRINLFYCNSLNDTLYIIELIKELLLLVKMMFIFINMLLILSIII